MMELVDAAQDQLTAEKQQLAEQIDSLGTAIKFEQDRLSRSEALQNVIDSFMEKRHTLEHRIRVCSVAEELLIGAARHLSHRFNQDLRELVSRTLPLFTEERYEHLQIDDDLNVSVFSSEKRDFMELDEISSGTQRQIMLAVRLALSQELVNTVVSGDQFVFLDEPFAFFDQQRTRNSMAVLPQLSDDINQVWVIAQEFPEDTVFDREIKCSRDYVSLTDNTNSASG